MTSMQSFTFLSDINPSKLLLKQSLDVYHRTNRMDGVNKNESITIKNKLTLKKTSRSKSSCCAESLTSRAHVGKGSRMDEMLDESGPAAR